MVSEFAIFTSKDDFPGIIGSKIPLKPLTSPLAVTQCLKKTLYLYRFKLSMKNISEDEILQGFMETIT